MGIFFLPPAKQLITASDKAHTDAYAYDGNGNRVSITEDGDSTYEFYQGDTLLYRVSASSPSTNSLYLHLDNHLVAEIDNGQNITWLYTDLLGSPIAGISDSGTSWTQEYAPYGQELTNLSPQQPNSHVGYTGKINDHLSGLSYYNARYYNPAIGRFLSADPAAVDPPDPMSFNRYAYANNNPYKYIDPTGMFSWNNFFNSALSLLGQFAMGFNFGASAGTLSILADGMPIYNKPLFYTGEAAGTFASMASGVEEGVLATQAAEEIGTVAEGAVGLGNSSSLGGAKNAMVEYTQKGERFVRVGASPENLRFSFHSPGGVQPGTYAFPEESFLKTGGNPTALKNFGDLPGNPPQYYRILEPPAGTAIQRGVVPGGEFGGRGGISEVIFPEGY